MVLFASVTQAVGDPFEAARSALERNQIEAAEVVLTPLVAMEKPDARTFLYLSQVRVRQKRTKEAIALAEKAVAADPTSALYQSNLGAVLGARMSEVSFMETATLAYRMVAAFKKSVEIDRDHVPGYRALARYYASAPAIGGGSREMAEHYAHEAQKRDEFVGTFELAAIAERFKDWPRALAGYTKAAELQPANATVTEKLKRVRAAMKPAGAAGAPPPTSVPESKTGVAGSTKSPREIFTRTESVNYGRSSDLALTLDVFQPKLPNGAGIIYLVSGGFLSSRSSIDPAFFETYLGRGYTVFAVVHRSQPQFVVPEMVEDIRRAVRFIRHNASTYGIAPNKLGVMGLSSGGYLALALATQSDEGAPNAADRIDRESSAVQAVACFSPPTDFLNYGAPGTEVANVERLKELTPALGPLGKNADERQQQERALSPIYFVSSKMPPTLILHGNVDELVPLQQSESFVERVRAVKGVAKLIVKIGAGHGWADMSADTVMAAGWFDEYLSPKRR